MKKFLFSLFLITFLCASGWTQSVPNGMKYQAVARDLSGDILGNERIDLHIILHSDIKRQVVEYSEFHEVTTNELGLFTLVIGEGLNSTGKFSEVPWSSKDIWMEVAIKPAGKTAFATISNSRLLAVPYAFHAGTASKIIGQHDIKGPPNGVPANVWSLFGNSNTDDTEDRLGTTDCADLVIITNSIERLRITCEGNVEIQNDLSVGNDLDVGNDAHIGNDLTVDQNVDLNVEGGSTTVNGNLTVDNMSSTYLTGTLDVDKATNLNSTLEVDGATDLNSTLEVDGATDLNDILTVDGATDLNSSLNVDGTTNLNDDLTVTGMSSTVLTGTLEVDKATTLNSTLDVDGNTNLGSDLNVGGDTHLNGTLEVDGAATFNDDVDITGGIEAASSYISGPATLPLGGQSYVACFENTDDSDDNTDGIAIKIGNNGDWKNNGQNDYVTFFNGQGEATGSIEGFDIIDDNPLSTFPLTLDGDGAADIADIFNIEDFTGAFDFSDGDWANMFSFEPATLTNFNIDFTGFDFGFNFFGGDWDVSSSQFNVGSFDVTGFFTPGLTTSGQDLVDQIVCWGISNGMESLITTNPFDLLLAGAIIAQTNICKENGGKGGVTYVSFGADYAEWLPRADFGEGMSNGQIVGIKNGKISKTTDGADQILPISTNPIVLGNKPLQGQEDAYEKVAFMGQVPVIVKGKVNVGDYILASGKNDGFGRAVPPDDILLEDLPLIVGKAWSASQNDVIGYVNVAVGLNRNDIVTVAKKQDEELQKLKDEVALMRNELEAQMTKLVLKIQELEPSPGSDAFEGQARRE